MSAEKTKTNIEQHLKIFCSVYKNESMTKTAVTMNIQVSKVYASVEFLRRKYEDPLFIYIKRKLIPTDFAKILFEKTNALTFTEDASLLPSTAEPAQERFVISCTSQIGVTMIPLAYMLAKDIAPFSLAHIPLVGTSTESAKRLLNNDVDVIFDYSPLKHDAINSRLLFKEEFAIVCSKNHPRLSQTISKSEYLQEKHGVLRSPPHNTQTSPVSELTRSVFHSQYYIDILALVEVSDLICAIPMNIYLKMAPSFNIKSLNYNFKIESHKQDLYMNTLKAPYCSGNKMMLIEKFMKLR